MRKKGWQMAMRAGPLLLLLLLVKAMQQKSQNAETCCVKCKMVPVYVLVSVLFLGATSLNAFGLLGFGNSASWKEEVLLHDGRKIIVERSQSRGGRGEVGQNPIKEHSITFTLPGSKKEIIWKDEFSQNVGHSNFDLLALHIQNDTPYIVVSTYGCLAYNKWGRPNPPYVIFRYDGKEWQRIPLTELPGEFKDINLVINASAHEKELVHKGVAPARMVRELNSSLKNNPEYKSIIREPLPPVKGGCPEMVYDGNGGWLGVDWFTSEPTYEACLQVCEKHKISTGYCPCDSLLKTNSKWR